MSELHISRSLPASPEGVWRAFTDPDALAAWFWPTRFAPAVAADVRPGGRYRIDGPGAGIAVGGEYVAVNPPRRLAFTWQWDGESTQTRVTVELTPSRTGTDLALTHQGFAGDAERDNHVTGWSDCLDRLPAWLALPRG
jgi:uncharacterized protein YndB with AHSA1/START domain